MKTTEPPILAFQGNSEDSSNSRNDKQPFWSAKASRSAPPLWMRCSRALRTRWAKEQHPLKALSPRAEARSIGALHKGALSVHPMLSTLYGMAITIWLAVGLEWSAFGQNELPFHVVGQWPGHARGDAAGVAVQGTYAYVADGDEGLQVIDVSDPANPRRVGGYDTSGEANVVWVAGDKVYVADGSWGLSILHVASPSSDEPLIVPGSVKWLPDGCLRFELNGATTHAVEIHASTNLIDWTRIDIVPNGAAQRPWVDFQAQQFGKRFYRLKRQ